MRSFLLLVFLILRWKDFERANVKRIVTLILSLITDETAKPTQIDQNITELMSEIFNILHKLHMFTNSQATLYLKLISVQKMQYILHQINIDESDFNSVLKFHIRNK